MRKNLVALYGVQLATFVLPLLTMPFLARALGPGSLGKLSVVQSLFGTIGFLVEYGFGLSATRMASIYRNDRKSLTLLVSNVIGAKCILSIVFLFISLSIYVLMPIFNDMGVIFWIGFLNALIQGFGLLWFYQGIERLSMPALVDVVTRFFYAGLIILFINSPEDVGLVLILQGITTALSVFVNAFRMRNLIDKLKFSLSGSINSLKDGRSMFYFRAVNLLYTSSNAVILRFFTSNISVGHFSAAERLTGAGSSAINPLTQLIYPRLSYLIHHDLTEAKVYFKRSLSIILIASTFIVLTLFFLAPLIVNVVFGVDFGDSIHLLRIMAFSIFFVSLTNLFGLHWMIPNKLETQFNKIILGSVAFGVPSMLISASRWKSIGMAYSITAIEASIALLTIIYVIRSGKSPFRS